MATDKEHQRPFHSVDRSSLSVSVRQEVRVAVEVCEVFNSDTQVNNGTYYRLNLTVEDGVVTKKYQAIVLDRDYFNLISFTPLEL